MRKKHELQKKPKKSGWNRRPLRKNAKRSKKDSVKLKKPRKLHWLRNWQRRQGLRRKPGRKRRLVLLKRDVRQRKKRSEQESQKRLD